MQNCRASNYFYNAVISRSRLHYVVILRTDRNNRLIITNETKGCFLSLLSALIKHQECSDVLTTAATDLRWECHIKEFLLLINTSECSSIKVKHRNFMSLCVRDNIQISPSLKRRRLSRLQLETLIIHNHPGNLIKKMNKRSRYLEKSAFCFPHIMRWIWDKLTC